MIKLPAIFKQKPNSIKEKILKNNEALLDVMGKSIKGARQCPFLAGQKCLGQFCEMFLEFKSKNDKTEQEFSYWRCAIVQQNILTIELNNNIRELIKIQEKR